MANDVTQTGLTGLSRYTYKRMTGWLAGFRRRGAVSKLFSDARYGWDEEASRPPPGGGCSTVSRTGSPVRAIGGGRRHTTAPGAWASVCAAKRSGMARVVWVYDVREVF